jgi:hypothetical protein
VQSENLKSIFNRNCDVISRWCSFLFFYYNLVLNLLIRDRFSHERINLIKDVPWANNSRLKNGDSTRKCAKFLWWRGLHTWILRNKCCQFYICINLYYWRWKFHGNGVFCFFFFILIFSIKKWKCIFWSTSCFWKLHVSRTIY